MTRNQLKTVVERHAATIRQLRKQLGNERRLNNALSKLAFAPPDRQDPIRLNQVRRAATLKRLTAERRAA